MASYCFHCQVPTVPALEHQGVYCLLSAHVDCPVYTQPETTPFPRNIKLAGVRHVHGRRQFWQFIVLGFGILLAVFMFWLGSQTFSSQSLLIAQPEKSRTPSLASPTASATSSPPANTSTPIPPTPVPSTTPVPSPSPTEFPTQIHALDVPIGREQKFLIHRITTGENLIILAKKYKTSSDAILRVNYQLKTPVWLNTVIVIPVNKTDLVGLPVFELYQVVDREITVEALASKLNTDLATLKQFNVIDSGGILHKGDWILVLHQS
jgi:LysM repeat protein